MIFNNNINIDIDINIYFSIYFEIDIDIIVNIVLNANSFFFLNDRERIEKDRKGERGYLSLFLEKRKDDRERLSLF